MTAQTIAELKNELAVAKQKVKCLETILQNTQRLAGNFRRKIDVAHEILNASVIALSRAELLEAMKIQGVEMLPDTLSQALSRDYRFAGLGRGRAAKWITRMSLTKA